MTKEIRKAVYPIVDEEIDRIKTDHGPIYASDHEGYAVLLEEIEEAEEELRTIRHRLGHIWANRIRKDLKPGDNDLTYLSARAVALAAEAIQISAVSRKWRDGNRQEKITDEAERWYYEHIAREDLEDLDGDD